MTSSNRNRIALTATALAAVLALAACNRSDSIPTPQTGANSGSASTDAATASSSTTAPTMGTATTSDSSTVAAAGTSPATTTGTAATTTAGTTTSPSADGSTPGSMVATNPPGAIAPSTANLPAPDADFVTKAAEGGLFELQVAKLAVDKATDPAVKAFAQMLLDDHTVANDKLLQIAASHSVPLPAAVSDAKKKEIDQLAKLSGAEFDRQFIKSVGLSDHKHDILEFEKASRTSKSEDVKSFAHTTLPTLKKHLEAAQKLPAPKG
jgi:putative membrane protein